MQTPSNNNELIAAIVAADPFINMLGRTITLFELIAVAKTCKDAYAVVMRSNKIGSAIVKYVDDKRKKSKVWLDRATNDRVALGPSHACEKASESAKANFKLKSRPAKHNKYDKHFERTYRKKNSY